MRWGHSKKLVEGRERVAYGSSPFDHGPRCSIRSHISGFGHHEPVTVPALLPFECRWRCRKRSSSRPVKFRAQLPLLQARGAVFHIRPMKRSDTHKSRRSSGLSGCVALLQQNKFAIVVFMPAIAGVIYLFDSFPEQQMSEHRTQPTVTEIGKVISVDLPFSLHKARSLHCPRCLSTGT